MTRSTWWRAWWIGSSSRRSHDGTRIIVLHLHCGREFVSCVCFGQKKRSWFSRKPEPHVRVHYVSRACAHLRLEPSPVAAHADLNAEIARRASCCPPLHLLQRCSSSSTDSFANICRFVHNSKNIISCVRVCVTTGHTKIMPAPLGCLLFLRMFALSA